jgi:hypothetical protein
MTEPVPWIFFCTEADYPKFRSILPRDLPAAYDEFVSGVDSRIKNMMEHQTIVKTNVGFDEFLAFCTKNGKEPNYDSLVSCTFHTWGANRK